MGEIFIAPVDAQKSPNRTMMNAFEVHSSTSALEDLYNDTLKGAFQVQLQLQLSLSLTLLDAIVIA